MPRDQVFISYSHKDKRWCDDLEIHLKPYLRGGSIVSWSDEQIAPGSEWLEDIQFALANSKVAVLLVSPDFLASDFIHEHELGPLPKEAEQGGVKILWVPLRESAYKQTPLKNYQALLDPSKPLASITKARRDEAWVKICEEIEKAVRLADLGTGEERLRLAYLTVLGQPERFELLEHLDPQELRKAVAGLGLSVTEGAGVQELLAKIAERFPSSVPSPLWLSWMEIVNEEKVKREEAPGDGAQPRVPLSA